MWGMLPVPAPRDQGDRVLGIDLTRGVAIIAMVIAHVRVWSPYSSDDDLVISSVLAQVNNLASPLFALVMGVSVGLVSLRPGVTPAAAIRRDVVRGLLLIATGLALNQLGTFIAIVLQHLGVTLIVGTVLARLRLPVLTIVTAATFLAAPLVNAAARAALPGVQTYRGAPWEQVLEWIVLSPYYRLTNLLPFFLLGVVMAVRHFERRLLVALLAVGALSYLAFVALWLAGFEVQTSGSYLDTLSDVGLAVTTASALILLAPRLPAAARAVLAPVVAVGTVSLSAYVFHVVLIDVLTVDDARRDSAIHWAAAGGLVLAATVGLGWMWWRVVGVGPLERLLAAVAGPLVPEGKNG